MTEQSLIVEALSGKDVVVDTNSRFVYIGRLASANEQFLELRDVDVHDCGDSNTPKEIYVIDARKYGIKRNRESVFVMARQVISISPLEGIIEY